jgi:hypothetical protein
MDEQKKQKRASSPAQVRAVKKYQTEKVDRLVLLVPKGMKQTIKDHAAALGQSSTKFCLEAITDRIKQQDGQQGSGETTL